MSGDLTHRERFRRVASRNRADRAVFDLCGSPQTCLDYAETRDALTRYLSLEPSGRDDGRLDERALVLLDIDTRRVGGMPTPPTVHSGIRRGVRHSPYGIGYIEVNGHLEICHNPLRGCTIDEMLAYPMPEAENIDPARIRDWAEDAERLHKTTDYAVIAEHPVLGVFELGCWMFGFDDYLYRLAAEPEMVHAFSERVLAYQKKVVDIYYAALGRHIDGTTSGDDFGMQTGPFLSAGMFGRLIKPYLKERIAYTRRHTDAFYKHHTCGSVYALIPDLIDCGVDILNPIQPGAYKMEPERLKGDFGNRIAFWGGIDTQHLLPRGSAEEVKAEVCRVLEIMDDGYILAPAHCIQNDVPAHNIAAIYEGARAFYAGERPAR